MTRSREIECPFSHLVLCHHRRLDNHCMNDSGKVKREERGRWTGVRGKTQCVWCGILSQQLVQNILSGSSVVGMFAAAGSILLEEHLRQYSRSVIN